MSPIEAKSIKCRDLEVTQDEIAIKKEELKTVNNKNEVEVNAYQGNGVEMGAENYIFMKSRQRQKQAKTSITQNKGTIILDDIQAEDTVETKWWIARLNLLDSNKEILSSGAWLNGSIISACQVF